MAQHAHRHDQYHDAPQCVGFEHTPWVERALGQQWHDHQCGSGQHQRVLQLPLAHQFFAEAVQGLFGIQQNGTHHPHSHRHVRVLVSQGTQHHRHQQGHLARQSTVAVDGFEVTRDRERPDQAQAHQKNVQPHAPGDETEHGHQCMRAGTGNLTVIAMAALANHAVQQTQAEGRQKTGEGFGPGHGSGCVEWVKARQPARPANTFCTSSLASMAARKLSTSSSCSALRVLGSMGFLGR